MTEEDDNEEKRQQHQQQERKDRSTIEQISEKHAPATTTPAGDGDNNKVLVERNGKFVYVDVLDVEVEINLGGKHGANSSTNKQPETAPAARERPQRVKSARSSRSKHAVGDDGLSLTAPHPPRPKSASHSTTQTKDFHGPPGTRMVPFSSQSGRNAFEGWLRRKEQQLIQERQRKKQEELANSKQKKDPESSKAAFEAWKRRKEEQKRSQKEQQLNHTTGSMGRTKRDKNEIDENFRAWCLRKAEEQRKRKAESRALIEDRSKNPTHKSTADLTRTQADTLNDQAVKEWLRQKRIQKQLEKQEMKRAIRHHAREARIIKENLRRIYMSDVTTDLKKPNNPSSSRPASRPSSASRPASGRSNQRKHQQNNSLPAM